MPLVRIDLVQGKSAEYRRAIGGVVYEAMVDVLKAPKDDRFQVIAVADALHARLGLRPEDVFINLIEVQKENCSSGTGSPNTRSSRIIGGSHDLF